MTAADDFEVAKAVADQLKSLDRDRQVRVLRWVSESLGISAPSVERSAARMGQEGPSQNQGQITSPGATNIKSFIESKAPKSDNQFVAAVAYFYRFEAPPNERVESIGAAKVQEAARLAGRKRLGDPAKTLRNAKNVGYLDNAARGEYKINSVGENLVAMTLPGGGGGTKVPKKVKRSKKKKAN